MGFYGLANRCGVLFVGWPHHLCNQRKGQDAMKTKIYGFCNSYSPGWEIAMALAETGQVLATHCCSSEGFMPGDLGMDGGDWSGKHEVYNEAFPDGWEAEFVWSHNIDKHEGLQAAIKKAKERNDAVHEKAALAGVTATVVDDDGKEQEIHRKF